MKVGKLREAFRWMTAEGRYRYVAWNWLRPHHPPRTLNDLPGLQRNSGLDHVDRAVFVPRLIEECKEILRDHPRLQLWIRKRIALLEFLSESPPAKNRDELYDVGINLRHANYQALSYGWQNGLSQARAFSTDTMQRALEAAAQNGKQRARKERLSGKREPDGSRSPN